MSILLYWPCKCWTRYKCKFHKSCSRRCECHRTQGWWKSTQNIVTQCSQPSIENQMTRDLYIELFTISFTANSCSKTLFLAWSKDPSDQILLWVTMTTLVIPFLFSGIEVCHSEAEDRGMHYQGLYSRVQGYLRWQVWRIARRRLVRDWRGCRNLETSPLHELIAGYWYTLLGAGRAGQLWVRALTISASAFSNANIRN